MEKKGDGIIVENAMNLAIAHIQDQLGQKDGGFAGNYFTQFAPSIPAEGMPVGTLKQLPEWAEMVDALLEYLKAERENVNRENFEDADLYVRSHCEEYLEVLPGSPSAFDFISSFGPPHCWIGGSWLLTQEQLEDLEKANLERCKIGRIKFHYGE